MLVVLRPEIASLAPYRQGRPAAADAFKLSSNESPFPPLPSVLEAIAGGARQPVPGWRSHCPAREARRAGRRDGRRGARRRRVRVASSRSSFRQRRAPATRSLYSWRSFEAYPGLVTVAGATSVTVPNLPDGRHDLDAMAAAITDRTRVVIVCTPNNPTSTIVTAARVRRLHGRDPRHRARAARRGLRRVRHRPARRRRSPSARALPEPGGAPHLLQGLRARRTAHRLRGRARGHPGSGTGNADPPLRYRPAQRAALAALEPEPRTN